MEKCDFDKQFLFNSYLLNFLSNFIKIAVFNSWNVNLSKCKRIISVHQMSNALEEVKVRLTFFFTTCISSDQGLVARKLDSAIQPIMNFATVAESIKTIIPKILSLHRLKNVFYT